MIRTVRSEFECGEGVIPRQTTRDAQADLFVTNGSVRAGSSQSTLNGQITFYRTPCSVDNSEKDL